MALDAILTGTTGYLLICMSIGITTFAQIGVMDFIIGGYLYGYGGAFELLFDRSFVIRVLHNPIDAYSLTSGFLATRPCERRMQRGRLPLRRSVSRNSNRFNGPFSEGPFLLLPPRRRGTGTTPRAPGRNSPAALPATQPRTHERSHASLLLLRLLFARVHRGLPQPSRTPQPIPNSTHSMMATTILPKDEQDASKAPGKEHTRLHLEREPVRDKQVRQCVQYVHGSCRA
ncbi:MAG: hypothetical protein U1F10_00525 [Burkholderiales bacterium]